MADAVYRFIEVLSDEAIKALTPPPPTLQLETATSEDLAALRIKFPRGDYAQIGELTHG